MILPIFYNKVFHCWECDAQTPMKEGFTMPIEAKEQVGKHRIIGLCGKCFATYSKVYNDVQRHKPK